jgi:hypothetical protein
LVLKSSDIHVLQHSISYADMTSVEHCNEITKITDQQLTLEFDGSIWQGMFSSYMYVEWV